jgi:hypothetical protein
MLIILNMPNYSPAHDASLQNRGKSFELSFGFETGMKLAYVNTII